MIERQPPKEAKWNKSSDPMLKGVFEAVSLDSPSGVRTEWTKWLRRSPRIDYRDIHPNGAVRDRTEWVPDKPIFEVSGRNELR